MTKSRVKTKWELYNERYAECDYCGEKMQANDIDCHRHHTLVFKSDLPKKKQKGIDDPINLMLVHAEPCHTILQSDREAGYEYKLEQVGREAIVEYLESLKFKNGIPRRFNRIVNGYNGR